MTYSIGDFVENDDPSGSGILWHDAPSFTPDAGSALVAFVWYYRGAGATTITMSDTAGGNDSWTEVGSGLFNGGNGMRAFVLLDAAATATTARATFAASSQYPAIAVVEVKGIVTSSAIAGEALQTQATPGTGTDGVTSGNTGTLTGQPAAVIAGSVDTTSTGTPAVGTGYTNIGTGWDYGGATSSARFEHKLVTSTSAVAGTFTAGSDVEHQTIVVALLETTSGGDVNSTPGAGTAEATGLAPIMDRGLLGALGSIVAQTFAPLVNPQYARPSADVSDGGWTPSTGADLYAVIDEAARDDGDYIQSATNPSNDTCTIKLATITLPGTNEGFQLQWAAGAVGATGTVVGSLRQGNSPGTEIASWTHANLPVGSYAEFGDAVTAAQAANITDGSDLYLRIVAS